MNSDDKRIHNLHCYVQLNELSNFKIPSSPTKHDDENTFIFISIKCDDQMKNSRLLARNEVQNSSTWFKEPLLNIHLKFVKLSESQIMSELQGRIISNF